MRQSPRHHPLTLAVAVVLLAWGAACDRPIDRTSSNPPSSSPADAPQDYDRHVRSLSAATPPAKARASHGALYAAGMDAFPTLLAHLDDKAVAAFELAGARAEPITVGEVCFELVQLQIEGAWPKAFRDFHVLTPDNTRQWLAAHSGLTLEELRRAATKQAVAQTEAALAANPSNGYLQKAVPYLKKRNRELEDER